MAESGKVDLPRCGGDPPALHARMMKLLSLRRAELEHEGWPLFRFEDFTAKLPFLKRQFQLMERQFTDVEIDANWTAETDELLDHIETRWAGCTTGASDAVFADNAMPQPTSGVLAGWDQAQYFESLSLQQLHASVASNDFVAEAYTVLLALDLLCTLDPSFSGVMSRDKLQRSIDAAASRSGAEAAMLGSAVGHSSSVVTPDAVAFLTPERMAAIPWDEHGEAGFVALLQAMGEWTGATHTEYDSDDEHFQHGSPDVVEMIDCIDEPRRQPGDTGCVLM